MNECGSVRTAAFSREMRRRLSQSRREQRPPTSGRRPTGGTCCLIFLLIVVAVVIYAFLEAYVFGPRRNEETQSFARLIIARTTHGYSSYECTYRQADGIDVSRCTF